ncbi:hypothetical protein K1T71_010635 [Dendrolimus kikuchii]|uniref:Uncharacterized protein n=1 Tax=Dendrolimus kikuchii TaxID=765133 RepID=A0ACC1CPP0_9NEOP|nr:hypothetical protein K1T71_010635 [Dendrolimus kikuchii]
MNKIWDNILGCVASLVEIRKSIYFDAIVDNRGNNAWNIWRPLDFLLTLTPFYNSDVPGVHCSVTLHFKCCPNYPNRPPILAINKLHGLSMENGAKLLAELQEMASRLCGEVMIFQLAQHTRQFLDNHNKPTLSCHEEMIKQQKELEKVKLHDEQVKENEARQNFKDEINEILRCAGRRIQKTSISQDTVSNDDQAETPELVFYADDKMSPAKKKSRVKTIDLPCTCSNKGVQVLRVTQKNNKKVYIGNCLGHSSNGATTYLAIDDETGERLITKKWLIPPATDFQSRNRKLTALQQDLKAMSHIIHPSLVPYIVIEQCKEVNKRTTKQCIYVFRTFILGSSMRFLKNKLCYSADKYEVLKLLRHVGLGVLSALKELHSVGVLHRDVRSENVYLDDHGTVKLVGAGLDSRLTEIVDNESYCYRQTEAQDIYATGQLLLSIVSQERTYAEIPQDLPGVVKDFISRCLAEDEHSQSTAEQLLSHLFLLDTPTQEPRRSVKDNAGSGSEDDDPVKKIHHSSPLTNGHSRLHAEFEVLDWLGKGAFGDVLKVKNKLDGGFYAIKRVKLNPESVQLNKKITREVKLLSRLNHENVVRYFNAWIETTTEQDDSEENSLATKTSSVKPPMDSLMGVVAKLGQEVKIEWSMSEAPMRGGEERDSSSDSEAGDDDDEADPWFTIIRPEDETSEESSIEFERDSDDKSITIPSEDVVDAAPMRPQSVRLHQVLYIQMEFCEKHTLRQAIDTGLYQEHFRAWRLFREIVEGLAHVHQRGMIHRDLKPVNIFLDSNDHVKIGDFGLATKAFTALPVDEKLKNQEEIGGSLTGQVGTALYVAPELLQTSKVIYNQKVDIYSLGVILFEMFHPPLDTGMERMLVLTELRTKDILLPKSFIKVENAKQIHVIRWLLNHEASLRPTCAELLASEHVPRPVPEGALSGLLSHALSDRGARGYQRLITACLDQRVSAAEDYTYQSSLKAKPMDALAFIKDAVVKVFRSHGASEFSPPLLIPRVKAWDQHPNAVKMMTSSGHVVHLPHDLRLPFARHTAYFGTKYMRRYVVDRVYRENRVEGFHPREIIECAFDIVTPKTDYLWMDAELMVVAYRAASESNLKVSLQMNHTDLLKTLLVSCGVPTERHKDIYPVLVDVSFGRITSLQLQTHLNSLCITSRDVQNLLRLMDAEVAVHEAKELVTAVIKQVKCGRVVCHALQQLEAVFRDARAMGCECPITVAPFLAYNATQHNGVFWQMSVIRENDNKITRKHRSGDLIAAGGRYDTLVEEFWKVARTEKDHDNSELKSCSVGFSMSLDRMAAILKRTDSEFPASLTNVESALICVCVWGTAGNGRDGLAAARRGQLAKDLWALGYNCCCWPTSSHDAHELAKPGLLLLEDEGGVRVISYEDVRVREIKVPYIDVIDVIKQKLSPDVSKCYEGSTSRAMSWTETEKSNCPIIAVTFITASERMTKNIKRQCENQINTKITSILVNLGLQPILSRVRVNVVAIACEAACVRSLASHLITPIDLEELPHVFKQVCDSYSKRRNLLDEVRIELTNIVKQSNQNRSNEETQLYALYSIPDSLCRLIT